MNNIRLGEELEKVLGIKVALERDVHMLYFWDKYEQKIADDGIGIGIYIGTGVGNAIFINGKPLAGKDGAAGELGHIPMIGGKEQCGVESLDALNVMLQDGNLYKLKINVFLKQL